MKTIINVVVVLRSFGEEPDGGPEPVAQRQLGLHLHLPVHEGEAARRPKSKECRISYRIIIIFKFMIYKKNLRLIYGLQYLEVIFLLREAHICMGEVGRHKMHIVNGR